MNIGAAIQVGTTAALQLSAQLGAMYTDHAPLQAGRHRDVGDAGIAGAQAAKLDDLDVAVKADSTESHEIWPCTISSGLPEISTRSWA